MSDYLADVRRYDPAAGEDVVAKIVGHLGIALRNRDSSLVSCSDENELDRVRQSWCAKKLGVEGEEAHATVMAVCQDMKDDRAKSRVTFYYLVAQKLGKLDTV